MKDVEKAWLAVFMVILIIVIVWLRLNLIFFYQILENSTLFFQLIIGATVIAVLRNFVGIKTFGVFGPTIIVFGLISAGLIWGLALYVDVFIIAMLVTLAIYPLGISSSHRVAIVITTTVITIMVMELFSEIFHMNMLQSSILFPVLITSWLAERYVGQVKEIYWVEPSKRLVGTLIVIIIAYFVMNIDMLIRFIALNPETWFIIIMFHIVLAVKVNIRLSDHLRFRPVLKNGKSSGSDILGLNRRNRDYIFKYNPRNMFPNVSKDKLKSSLHLLGIPAPRTYAIIEEKKDLKILEPIMETRNSFVIKPANGFGGEGILVLGKKTGDNRKPMFQTNGKVYNQKELEAHISEILDGRYGSDWTDVAIIEEKVESDDYMKNYSYGGIPDIRVIVFQGFPVMAMTRLPTKESEGKANLHKGAIGMGLTLSGGRGQNSIWRGHSSKIQKHPDTGAILTEMRIPKWSELLRIATLAQASTNLGYVGVDIVPDRSGPVVLEVNKRPGLEIQNTNKAGLLQRLEFIERKIYENPDVRFQSVDERVALSRQWDREGWK